MKQMGSMHPVQVIAVTGGKGGVGKTNVSVNLALALADLGRRVMLLDADLGLANVDVLLGLTPKRTLADVIEGRCELRDVLLLGPGGVRIVPAASGTQSMVHLSPMQHAGLIQAFSDISDNLDVWSSTLPPGSAIRWSVSSAPRRRCCWSSATSRPRSPMPTP